MPEFSHTHLGRTELQVGRLGVAASYGAPAAAFEAAFEKGCNYFYLGSGRHRAGMREAIRNICRKGHRDQLVIALQTYARWGTFSEFAFRRQMKSLGIEHADVLILGWHNRPPLQAPYGSCADLANPRPVQIYWHVRTQATAVP